MINYSYFTFGSIILINLIVGLYKKRYLMVLGSQYPKKLLKLINSEDTYIG